ncbi:MAG: polysaccharide deacetylase family protein [Actinomycetota bacterium]|nr:polysaccharide deacetylase family protein [Actinomycetota bacterium]
MASTVPSNWFVLCYHEIAWSEPRHLRGLSICHPPDIFADHLEMCSRLGDIVSYNEGRSRVLEGPLHRPQFTFSFDDGYAGVVRHAASALDAHGVSGIAAINPPFIDKSATFWRAQLCWLRHVRQIDLLKQRLGEFGYCGESVKDFTMDHFTDDVLEVIDTTYRECADEDQRLDREHLHMQPHDVAALDDRGWLIANHSARHLPLLEATASDKAESEYSTAEATIESWTGTATSMWVAPFDRPLERDQDAVNQLRRLAGTRDVALVDDRPAIAKDIRERMVYRVFVPMARATALVTKLRAASRRGTRQTPHREGS